MESKRLAPEELLMNVLRNDAQYIISQILKKRAFKELFTCVLKNHFIS